MRFSRIGIFQVNKHMPLEAQLKILVKCNELKHVAAILYALVKARGAKNQNNFNIYWK